MTINRKKKVLAGKGISCVPIEDATGLKAKVLNKNITVHSSSVCNGQKCCLHNPSDHHMKSWPIYIRMDKETLAERMCPHGIGHPDPDSLQWLESHGHGGNCLGVHGCDGCCDPIKRKRNPKHG
jgi:hypothetical protein